jgi:hypothetical protein
MVIIGHITGINVFVCAHVHATLTNSVVVFHTLIPRSHLTLSTTARNSKTGLHPNANFVVDCSFVESHLSHVQTA